MKNAIAKIINNHLNAEPPLWYDMIVTLNINISKGSDYGYVHVPCAFETLTHSIDLNPSLIHKKSREFIEFFNPKEDWKFIEDAKIENYRINKKKKKVVYNPAKFMIELSKAEKKAGFYLDEIERCSHCGQKTVIAEVKETTYKSCPIIGVKLSDKAAEDLVIPVKFGVARAQFYKGFFGFATLVILWFYITDYFFVNGQYAVALFLSLGLGWIIFFYTVRTTKLLLWYVENRPVAEINPKQSFWLSLGQQMGVL